MSYAFIKNDLVPYNKTAVNAICPKPIAAGATKSEGTILPLLLLIAKKNPDMYGIDLVL